MSVFNDRTFLLRVSNRLDRFTRKKDDLYNFRCPLCGDSQKNKSKSRGYIYRKQDNYLYMCHNCSTSLSFYNFLSHVAPELTKEYMIERYRSNSTSNTAIEPDFSELKTKPVFDVDLDYLLPSIKSLPESHHAKQYVISRKIPPKFFSSLYFADDFKTLVEKYDNTKELYPQEPRLVIPFHDLNNKLVGFQGRALGKSKIRYMTIRIKKDATLMYGINKIDEDQTILVVEGPIDSMFLPNAVAVTNSNLQSIDAVFDKMKTVLVFDNEPRNKDIVKLMDAAIDDHHSICIWPEMIVEKDINEMVLSGFSPEEIADIIETHTFVNLQAKLKLVYWKKTKTKGTTHDTRKSIK